MKIAVIGAGISGCLVARDLSRDHEVHVFEGNDHLGGHAHTIDVDVFGRTYSVDTGVLLFNERAYPRFGQLLRQLEVPVQDAEPCFAIQCDQPRFEYRGGSLRRLLSPSKNLTAPSYLALVRDVLRFRVHARSLARRKHYGRTLGEFLREHAYSPRFVSHYLHPLSAIAWPVGRDELQDVPVGSLIRVLDHLGLIPLHGSKPWKSIVGGTRTYVEQLVRPIRDRIHRNCRVTSVARNEDCVIVRTPGRPRLRFDQIVIATQANQALQLLADPTRAERQVLQSFRYGDHLATLHTDRSLLPRRRSVRSSWNCTVPADGASVASTTFDLSRLQQLSTPEPLLLTLNASGAVDPAKVLGEFSYARPVFGQASVEAQCRFREINGGRRTYFCGAYWHNGLHEGGVQSALSVLDCFHQHIGTSESTPPQGIFGPLRAGADEFATVC